MITLYKHQVRFSCDMDDTMNRLISSASDWSDKWGVSKVVISPDDDALTITIAAPLEEVQWAAIKGSTTAIKALQAL